MDLKKTFIELVRWGTENDTHRKELVNHASWLIAVLNESRGKKLSEEQLNKISAGWLGITGITGSLGGSTR